MMQADGNETPVAVAPLYSLSLFFLTLTVIVSQLTLLFLPVSITVSIAIFGIYYWHRGTEDPEYYAELLGKIPRLAERRLSSDGQSCPDIPGKNFDVALFRRLQTLLDAVADISLCRRGNVSATMASLTSDTDTLETKLYIVFNHENDESSLRCSEHLQNIFSLLRKVPHKPPAIGSPKEVVNDLRDDHAEICKAIHNYSFDIFRYRVTKHEDSLSDIRGYIEQTNDFLDQQRSALLIFLQHVDRIITMATTATGLPLSLYKCLYRPIRTGRTITFSPMTRQGKFF
jgi:hypothetical protein